MHRTGSRPINSPACWPSTRLNPDIIVAGGRDSGVFLSIDGGTSWRLLTDPFEGTLKDVDDHQVPDLPRPRFAHFKHAGNATDGALSLYIGTQGRGVWKIDVDFDLEPDSDETGRSSITITDRSTQRLSTQPISTDPNNLTIHDED